MPFPIIRTLEEFNEAVKKSHEKPLLLLKHSTACGISAGALATVEDFANIYDAIDYRMVLVIENRELSREIASITGIPHQSPQVILFHEGKPIWHTSHWSIRAKSMKKALNSIGIPVD
ncbi:MAG: bacillithiol system redox-active protein YtxJ [Calditrichaeota bacterium]|nr:MAG: bacillithiol system redox-active protein YtxJ [Calditrichota bacterium]